MGAGSLAGREGSVRLLAVSVALLGLGLGGLMGEARALLEQRAAGIPREAEVAAGTAVLEVHTHPEATLVVDRDRTFAAADVIRVEGLTPGPHVLFFRAATMDYAYRVQVEPGQHVFAVNLGDDPSLGSAFFIGQAAR